MTLFKVKIKHSYLNIHIHVDESLYTLCCQTSSAGEDARDRPAGAAAVGPESDPTHVLGPRLLLYLEGTTLHGQGGAPNCL